MLTPMGSQQDYTVVMIPTQIGDMVIEALYSSPRIIQGENGMKYEAQEKAETIADSLEKQFEPHHQLINEDLLKETRNIIKQKLQKKNKLKPSKINTTEVAKIFKKLPNNKAPGPDSFPNEALKRLPPQAIE
ncbi:hypothetical protein PR048_002995 [Dryococelus australis]|uniref:Reverse transcriptase n=1 Tax=Dryococelus australis TaxID=614101 RepID=A0ABQ9ILT7_9NEOP|nr:hypothetical protein PR048_002995 [Dryococelus australis]